MLDSAWRAWYLGLGLGCLTIAAGIAGRLGCSTVG